MEFRFEALPLALAVLMEGVVYSLCWYRISASDSFASRSRVLCTFFGRVMGSDMQTAALEGLEQLLRRSSERPIFGRNLV
jgi:hypothetical protein